MSEFPSLPLFTDAYLADTRHLSAQEHGAYLLLLMMAWRLPNCRLPDDDAKLSKWAAVDARTWKRIKPTVMAFWTLAEDQWGQSRLTREREFVSKRAEVARENGKRGGRPKPTENHGSDNPSGSERVSQTKAPSPSPSPRMIEPIAQQQDAARREDPNVLERCLEAAGLSGFREERHIGLMNVGPIAALIAKGYGLDADILPVIRERSRNKTFRSWAFFTDAIIEAVKAKTAIPQRTQDATDWSARVNEFYANRTWGNWGPKPGEPGCQAPAYLIREAAA